jgi:hypothetical protein
MNMCSRLPAGKELLALPGLMSSVCMYCSTAAVQAEHLLIYTVRPRGVYTGEVLSQKCTTHGPAEAHYHRPTDVPSSYGSSCGAPSDPRAVREMFWAAFARMLHKVMYIYIYSRIYILVEYQCSLAGTQVAAEQTTGNLYAKHSDKSDCETVVSF